MAQEKMTLAVRPRGTWDPQQGPPPLQVLKAKYHLGKPVKKLPEEVTVTSSGQASELYRELAAKSGVSVHRLKVTKGSDGALVPNSKDVLIQSTGLRQQSTVYVKDLGPQIQWRTVFLVEYLGPLLIHPPLYYFLSSPSPSSLQTLSLNLILIHFLKRELETLFIHRFSTATMPAANIFKNSAHYWLLSGVNMAYWIYRPQSAASRPSNPLVTSAGLTLFVIGELGNLSNHITLRNLRKEGTTKRGIPRGLGFGWVTCPNYLFETVAWVGIALVTWSLSAVVFVIAAIVPMAAWAKKKEVRYRKEFGAQYPRKKYVMLPGIW